ncbi:pilus assembly FimT family protein [Salinibius halmophilus]|uniref:pilus assembly FimT family protein n=1 Tax=Salinibius halmophilus TaxID=1853216 RepID=UPI000E669855|nr:type II secretion system protein [Salinibius halmophilus]
MFVKGFTLVELIVVILLVSILAAVAVPRIANPQQMSEPAARQLLVSSIGLVQQRAVAQQCAYAITINNNGWQAQQAADCTTNTACWQAVSDMTGDTPFSGAPIRWVYWQKAWYDDSNNAANNCSDLETLTTVVAPTTSFALNDGNFSLHGWTGYAQ